MEQIISEIAALSQQIQDLQEERTSLTINNVVLSENDSPIVIAEAYRRFARENSHLAVELKGIDDAIAALEFQLQEKQANLARWQIDSKELTLQQQLEEARNVAQVHAQRINILAAELATEIRLLKSCADHLSPIYWQVYYKPFITGFKTISVPYVPFRWGSVDNCQSHRLIIFLTKYARLRSPTSSRSRGSGSQLLLKGLPTNKLSNLVGWASRPPLV